MMDFHTRELILNHVRYRSEICRGYYLLGEPVFTEIEADAAAKENKQKLKLSAELNCYPQARQVEPALRACCVKSLV